MVGGMILFWMVNTQTAASKAPAAPIRCPVMDLVELMGLVSLGTEDVLMALVSVLSFSGVEVPWR